MMHSGMWHEQDFAPDEAEAYRSGDTVSPGAYKEIASDIVILLDSVQPLPASDSGDAIWYVRLTDGNAAQCAS